MHRKTTKVTIRCFCLLCGAALTLAACSGTARRVELPSGPHLMVVEGIGYEPPERPAGQASLSAKLEGTAAARRILWDQLLEREVNASGTDWVETGGVELAWLVANDPLFASRLRALLGDLQVYTSRPEPQDRSVSVWMVLDRREVLALTERSMERLRGNGA